VEAIQKPYFLSVILPKKGFGSQHKIAKATKEADNSRLLEKYHILRKINSQLFRRT